MAGIGFSPGADARYLGESLGAALARRYMLAARAPESLKPQDFGLWTIERRTIPSAVGAFLLGGVESYTLLWQATLKTLHTHGHLVMEDSARELRKHLPIWMAAHGRVLVSGLGLGCVVRGLLAKPEVDHVDVLELDAGILRVVGAEFAADPRVTLHEVDALRFDPRGRRWDFAWHDISTPDDDGLQALHGKLIAKFFEHAGRQGAWGFPRCASRALALPLVGGPRLRMRRHA